MPPTSAPPRYTIERPDLGESVLLLDRVSVGRMERVAGIDERRGGRVFRLDPLREERPAPFTVDVHVVPGFAAAAGSLKLPF